MSGSGFPVVVEGIWTSTQAKSMKNKLLIYFQSNKKSGGGECQVEVEESSPKAVVVFSSEEGSPDAESQIPAKENPKTPTPASPQPQNPPSRDETPASAAAADEEETVGVVLENISDLSRELLTMLVENISGLEPGDYNVETILEVNKAVVTFNDPADTLSFISKSEKSKKLEKRRVTAWPLGAAKSIRVENLPPSASHDILELFFEKSLTCPDVITLIPEEQAAVLTFSDSKVLRNLKRDYKINGSPVKAYPYYESLDTALYGEDRPVWEMPKPFTEKVHHVIYKFLVKKNLADTINERMRPYYCSVDMGQAEVTLRPLPNFLRQSGLTEKQVDDWKSDALRAFRQQMAEFSAFECPASEAAWREAQKSVLPVLKEDGVLVMDTTRGVLTVAGRADSMKQIRATVEDIIKTEMSRVERTTHGVKEVTDLAPAVFYTVMEGALQKKIASTFPELKLAYADDSHKLSLEGLPAEVYQTKSWIFEMIPKISRKPLNLPSHILEFLTAINIDNLSRDLFTSHEIRAFLSVENNQAFLVGAGETQIQDAERKMQSHLHCRILDVEDAEVLKLQDWKDLHKTLLESYNSPTKQTVGIMVHPERKEKVTVAGFRSPVDEASDHLQKFLSSHARVQESFRVKSCAVVLFIEKQSSKMWATLYKDSHVAVKFKAGQRRILLEGFRHDVQSVKSKLEELAEGLLCESLVLDKPGAKKHCQKYAEIFLPSLWTELNCAVVLQPDKEEEEEDEAPQFSEGTLVRFCQVSTADGVLVSVGKGDICCLSVDAIVNAANERLDHIGGLALAILHAAGPKLQDICNDYISKNGKLQPGDAITTDPCNLPCKHVVHAVGPRYYQSDRKTSVSHLKLVVKRSLEQAEKNRCKTVALPAISSGIFGFPVELCARTIAEAVREYCDRADGPTSLEEIHLVDNTHDTVKALAAAVHSEFSDLNPVMMLPGEEESRGAGSHRDLQRGELGGRRNQAAQHGKVYENERGTRPKIPSGGRLNSRGRGRGYARPGASDMYSKGGHMPKQDRRKPANDGGLNTMLLEGNIQDQMTAVIVNTIDKSLDLSMGAVSKAILKAAGPGLQQSISAVAGSAFPQFGDVITTDGFNLKSQKVFHAICPHWDKGNSGADKALKSIIRFCLEEAEKLEMPSIAFPAIGTGNLKFPRSVVCGMLQQQIQDFIRTREYRHVKDVVIVVHPSDQETVKVATPSLGVYQMQMGPVGFEVLSGDITKEATDVIVNSSNDTFDLKSGVSKAILEAAGPAVEQECLAIVMSSANQLDHMITSAGSLPSKQILHIVGTRDVAVIKEVVYKVLKTCEESQFHSVSFPALGTGVAGVHPSAVAEAMIDAVVDFVRKKVPVHMREVKIVLFQAEMLAEFFKCMKKKEGEPVVEKSLFAKDTISSLFGKSEKEPLSPSQLVVKREEFEPAVFQLCADNHKSLTLAKKKIEDLIVDEQFTRTISDWYIAQLSRGDISQLEALQREMTVRIRLDKGTEEQMPHIHLEGLTRDVSNAESTIRELLRNVERQDNLRSKAKLLAKLVEWKYEERTGSLAVFDMFVNLELEEALKTRRRVKIKINGEEYDVDADKKKAVSTRGQNQMTLFRRDLKEEPDLPSNWGDMSDDLVKLFPLTPEDQEYQDLDQRLKAQGFSGKITRIERVQNRMLWQSYQLMKKEMEQKNKHQNNEMVLYHGTQSDAIAHINKQGFNRSYAGMHGALYGNGCYFAVDSKYSYNYAKPDGSNVRRMYVARVLVGDFVKGTKGLITPPSRNTGQAADLYDSVVDKDPNPTIHVIFNDIQAYPEYLLTFT
ncbi:protein mono-ADP-ribosyltransferase PARP14-like [Neosynchiropus ocellatus]